MTKRKTFTREFKLQALQLLERGEKNAADLARELGVPRNRLYKWREQLAAKGADSVFPGHGRQRGTEAELAALKRENARLKEENDILKKERTKREQKQRTKGSDSIENPPSPTITYPSR